MLERTSALAGVAPFEGEGVRISEASDFSLMQLAGDDVAMKKATGLIPAAVGISTAAAGGTGLRVGPNQVWIIGKASLSPRLEADTVKTPLNSSRTRIAIEGTRARDVLAKCAAIDFHSSAFKPGHFAMTGMHHMPVLVHCIEAERFHIYVMRTFALHMWEVLVDAAA